MTVALLPVDTTELPFKTLQRYADGREDAWIELPSEAAREPEMLAPPDRGTGTAAPAEASEFTDKGSDTGTTALIAGLLAAVAIGVGAWVWRARLATSTDERQTGSRANTAASSQAGRRTATVVAFRHGSWPSGRAPH